MAAALAVDASCFGEASEATTSRRPRLASAAEPRTLVAGFRFGDGEAAGSAPETHDAGSLALGLASKY